MPTDLPTLYDTQDAAAYCGLTASGFKHHIQAGNVIPAWQKRKITLFTQEELDRFKALKLKRGAPRKKRQL